jgi:hypothetical protein
MIRHVVLLEFRASTPDEHLEQVIERLRELPSRIPSLRAYTVGRDLGLADGNAHLAVAGDFDDVEGYVAYRDDPAHRAVIEQLILPQLQSRSAVQFEL